MTSTRAVFGAALWTTMCAAVVQAATPDFGGRYAGRHVVVTLTPDGTDGYTGTLELGTSSAQVVAKPIGAKLHGTITHGGQSSDFTATLSGDTLSLTMGPSVMTLTRGSGNAPPVTPPPGTIPDAGGNPPGPGTNTPTPPPVTPPITPPPHTDQPPLGVTPPPDIADLQGPPAPAVGKASDLGAVREDPNRKWTVMVYLDADNDLEAQMLGDLNEMEAGLTQAPGVEVIVLIDRAEGYDNRDGDWTDGRIYRVRPDTDPNKIASEVLVEIGEPNLGDPRLLAAFTGAAMKAFPAQRYMLVLWDHGNGWTGSANDHDAPLAEGGHDNLLLPEVRLGIVRGLKRAARKPKLDILAFDMCLMAQLENALGLYDCADYMLASEALVPGMGYPYHTMLPELARHGDDIPAKLKAMAKAFDTFYTDKGTGDITLSALDLRHAPRVAQAWSALVAKTGPALETQWPAASRAIFYAEKYMGRVELARDHDAAFAGVDLLDLARKLRNAVKPFPAEAEFSTLEQAIGDFVVASETDEIRRKSNGVSIYAPVVASMYRPEYDQQTPLGPQTGWSGMLRHLHALQQRDLQPPAFSDFRITDTDGKPIEAIMPLNGHHLRFTLTGDNIIWTQFWSAIREPGTGRLKVLDQAYVYEADWMSRLEEATDELELTMPQYKDGKNEMADEVLGLAFLISDGQNHATGTLDGSDLARPDQWKVRAMLKHKDLGPKPVEAVIFFDYTFWEATKVVGIFDQPDGTARLRVLEPAPDTEVTLLHRMIDVKNKKETWEPGGTLRWNKGLFCVLQPSIPGDYTAVLVAETMAGKRSVAMFDAPIKTDPELRNYVQGWKNYKPEHLVGEWDWYIAGQNNEELPTGATLKISATKDPGLFQVELRTKQKPDEMDRMLWIVDTNGLPNIRMINVMPNGDAGATFIAPAFYGLPDGRPSIVCKMANVGGQLWLYRKRGPGGVTPGPGPNVPGPRPVDPERLKPVETPDPQPLR